MSEVYNRSNTVCRGARSSISRNSDQLLFCCFSYYFHTYILSFGTQIRGGCAASAPGLLSKGVHRNTQGRQASRSNKYPRSKYDNLNLVASKSYLMKGIVAAPPTPSAHIKRIKGAPWRHSETNTSCMRTNLNVPRIGARNTWNCRSFPATTRGSQGRLKAHCSMCCFHLLHHSISSDVYAGS